MTTKELEKLLYKSLWKKGWYGVFECAVPRSYTNKYHRERVDLVSYETNGTFRFYELKVSLSDFHSDAKLTFLGDYNYLVMPIDLYNKVRDEIPKGVGVYAAYSNTSLKLVKRATKQEIKVNREDMKFAMMQALSREYKKYRKILDSKIK